LDFCLDILSPLTFRKVSSLGKYSLTIRVLVLANNTISFAYLTLQHPLKALYSFVLTLGLSGLTILSTPFKHKLHSIGDITLPCGVPALGRIIAPFSTMPVFSHLLIKFLPILKSIGFTFSFMKS